MTQYNEGVLRQFAGKLYNRASTLQAIWLLSGIAASLGASAFLARAWKTPDWFSVGIVILGALVGLAIGEAKALALKTEAQKVLCQVEIEQHLRCLTRSKASSIG